MNDVVRLPTGTGIYPDMPFDTYLATERVSKSGLWTLHTRSPAHARVEKEETDAMKRGTVIDCAVLEPHAFGDRFIRGPEGAEGKPLNKNTNDWKAFVREWGDRAVACDVYDEALALRDALRDNPLVQKLVGQDTIRQVTAFAKDPETGLEMRCRPDAYTPHHGILVDLKTTEDARPDAFRRRVGQLGYHLQERHYTDVWRLAGGDYKTFVFVVVEPSPPYAVKIYELNGDAIEEGKAIRRKALARWAECVASGVWPAYDTKPEVIGLHKWDYRETVPEAA